MGLEKIGVGVDKNGFIKADEELGSSQEHIFAKGDGKGPLLFEIVSAKEGNIACQNVLQDAHKKQIISLFSISSTICSLN